MDLLIRLIELFVFIVLQSLFINGVNECFKGGCINDMTDGKKCQGMIFYNINPDFFEKHKGSNWAKPFWTCVKCMSSVWGAATFWPVVVYLFGFNWVEIPVFIFDATALVTMNWIIYKKL